MTDTNIDVVYATDSKYLRLTSASILSLLANNPEAIVRRIFVLCDSELRPEISQVMRKQLGKPYRDRVQWVGVSNSKYMNLPISDGSWLSSATYLRLYAAESLPDDVKNLLYLDGDVLVRHGLGGFVEVFREMRRTGAVIGARPHPDRAIWRQERDRLQLDNYFNAGVFAIDAPEWRRLNLAEKITEFSFENRHKLKIADQDGLNLFFQDSYEPIGNSYNFFPNIDKRRDPVIVHFIGAFKPSLSKATTPYSKEFQRYIRRTYPFRFLVTHEIVKLWKTLFLTDLPPRVPMWTRKLIRK